MNILREESKMTEEFLSGQVPVPGCGNEDFQEDEKRVLMTRGEAWIRPLAASGRKRAALSPIIRNDSGSFGGRP